MFDIKGAEFYGNWVSGFLNFGEIRYSNSIYKGEILHNKIKHGKGTLKDKNNLIIFEGLWQNDQPKTGKLSFCNKNNTPFFEGEINCWKICGQGTQYYEESFYKGYLSSGIREGYGVFFYNLDLVMEGQFNNDQPQICKLYLDETRTWFIQGEWENYKIKNQNCIVYYKNGNKYKGNLNALQREGYGILYFSNGDKFEGYWKNNKQNGIGIYCFNNSEKYEGEFKNNEFDGLGTYYYKDDTKYQGKWSNNKWDGFGKLIDREGNIIQQGIWEKNKLFKKI